MSLSMEQVKEAFTLFDADGSGEIDQVEIKLVMQALGHKLSDTEVSDLMSGIDADSNRKVSYDEFESMMVKRMAAKDSREEMERAFKLFDHSRNGQVSVDDMVAVATSLGEDPEQARETLAGYISVASGGQDSMNLAQWCEVMETIKPRTARV